MKKNFRGWGDTNIQHEISFDIYKIKHDFLVVHYKRNTNDKRDKGERRGKNSILY